MKSKRLFHSLVVIFIVVAISTPLSLFDCAVPAASAAPAAPAKASWKMFAFMPATTWYVTGVFKPFAEEVKQKTNGRLEITVYTPGELPYKGNELLPALKNREIEMAEVCPTVVQGDLAMLGLWGYSFINKNWKEYGNMKNVLLPPTREALKNLFNVHWLFNGAFPPTQTFTRVPIKTLADLKGLRIRTVGSDTAEFQNALGGVGIAMMAGEVYTALQRGTVDGVGTSYTTMYSSKWHEVANYGIEWNNTITADSVCVNFDAWNALPKDVRVIVEELARKYEDKWYEQSRTQDDLAKQKMIAAGGKFVTLSEPEKQQLVAIAKPLWQKWASRYPGGQKLVSDVLAAIGNP